MIIRNKKYIIIISDILWGDYMQTIDISCELKGAINSIEHMLNGEDGERILETIRRYKYSKNLDNYSIKQIKK